MPLNPSALEFNLEIFTGVAQFCPGQESSVSPKKLLQRVIEATGISSGVPPVADEELGEALLCSDSQSGFLLHS